MSNYFQRVGSVLVALSIAACYYVEVVAIGHINAADSLTVGDDGAYLLAAIADYTPDIVCSR